MTRAEAQAWIADIDRNLAEFPEWRSELLTERDRLVDALEDLEREELKGELYR